MVEPLEETRSELIFATEPLLSSLHLSIPGSPHASAFVDLDEVEGSRIQNKTGHPPANKATTDPKRRITTMQGPIVSPHICAHHPLQYQFRKHSDQQRRTFTSGASD